MTRVSILIFLVLCLFSFGSSRSVAEVYCVLEEFRRLCEEAIAAEADVQCPRCRFLSHGASSSWGLLGFFAVNHGDHFCPEGS